MHNVQLADPSYSPPKRLPRVDGVVIDTRTGQRGTYAEWVAAFQERWADAKVKLDRFMDILSPEIRLAAPGLRPTLGREAGYRAFAKTFIALPDIKGHVKRWSASEDVLFIEMTFTATVGKRLVAWEDVDRFLFKDGVAVERLAFFDPTPIRRAYLSGPAGWLQLMRMRA
ncbi:MAG TPA: nuclear transport factor 2 family protein, partial [Myxococcaceae bacterium]|nr:nuclear transport factor 2 family protein [Myxococcaceae bacterium]